MEYKTVRQLCCAALVAFLVAIAAPLGSLAYHEYASECYGYTTVVSPSYGYSPYVAYPTAVPSVYAGTCVDRYSYPGLVNVGVPGLVNVGVGNGHFVNVGLPFFNLHLF